ncbi:Protein of unknown function [Chitinophaga costaii]|uniref:DUF4197 domain-containing protein n=2 Tax=Chitinophaga costaii TaxID=1335309 RepID=A0A1C4B2G4_9BACT|nr:DUF4197 domain-containing protein [Chitinophaga costaii]SCC00928.1 Protein of unknown function [Chitinophaga costaii]
MKRTLLLLGISLIILHGSQAQFLKKLKHNLDSVENAKNAKTTTTTTSTPATTSSSTSSTTSTGNVTQNQAAEAIKQALSKGVSSGIALLNKQNGFFGSDIYKVLLPPDAQKVESTLRQIGLGSQVDKAILQINRSAEQAVGQAAPIFVDAIKQMTITDALNIVSGDNTAATTYFKGKTTDKLKSAFSPVIKGKLDSTLATKYYSDIVATYNKLPTTINKANPDLQGYVTDKAIGALFDQIAKEESSIRTNPVSQTTDLLKKVFGGLGK